MIGIICFWDRLATPYLEKYERLLNSAAADYKIVFWKREFQGKPYIDYNNEREIIINYKCNKHGFKKYLSFYKWSNYVKQVLHKEKFEHIIVLSTTPAVFLFSALNKKYKNNYLFDIRDYTLENNILFSAIVTKLVKNSIITPISSKGFFRWLKPNDKIIINHNITVFKNDKVCISDLRNKEKINYAFVGNVRLDTQTKAMMINLKDSTYIDQHFYGRILSGCNIEEIIDQNCIKNAYLHGPFNTSDKTELYKEIDLINCVYANARTESEISLGDSTPIPNRLYDCLVFYKPMVVSKGTYLAELTEQYNLGITLNGFDENCEEQIKCYCKKFDEIEFKNNCDRLFDSIKEEELIFENKIKEIFVSWK